MPMRLLLLVGFASFIGSSTALSARPAEDAERIYMDYCSVCHGESGDGNSRVSQGMVPPPRDFTLTGLKDTLTRKRMMQIIRDGKPGTAMVGWKTQLNDTQIALVTDYISTRFMGVAKTGTTGSDRGRQIYATTCSVCHGEEGKGAVWGQRSLNPPPVNFSDPNVRKVLSRERMILSVTHGRPGTAMAGFGSQLSADDIAATVDFIRAEFMEITDIAADSGEAATSEKGMTKNDRSNAAHRAVTADMSALMPDRLTGDPDVGRAYYLQNCTACHGEAGDGKGPRAYFIFPKPRNFLDPNTRASFNRPRLFAAIRDGVIGKEMPAWGKVLDKQTIANVAEYVFQAFINPKDEISAQN